MTGTLYIVSAPSGCGKTSLVNALLQSTSNLTISISHTTRPPRPGEQDAVNYHFIDKDRFQTMIAAQEFLEHAEVFGHHYGTSRSKVIEQLEQGVDVILEIDWQGAQQIRAGFADTVSIFILPPSKEALRQRLQARRQDNADVIETRMQRAHVELSHYDEYDYLIFNDQFDYALSDLHAIVHARRLRLAPQIISHKEWISRLF